MGKMDLKYLGKRLSLVVLVAFVASLSLPGQVVIQRCDLNTGWQGGQTISVDGTDKKEGKGSLKTDAQTGETPWFSKAFSSTQTGITTEGYLTFWLYVSDASKLDGGQIEISSSGAPDVNEYNWPLSKADVVDGWNHMELQISTASESGGAADLDGINFFRIYQTLSGPVTAKIDFIRFTPSLAKPVWPVLDVPVVDNSSLDGKVMFGYQGWFNHPDDGANLGWVHWGDFYEPIRSTVDMYPDMREYGVDEKYPAHLSFPDGSMAPVFSSFNRNTAVRHMKWVRDYNLDGVFIQRFISSSGNINNMNHKDTVTKHIMEGCEKYGRVFAMMYDGVANKVEAMKSDWKHLVDDIGVTSSDRYLHHRGLPLVSLWGYTVRDDATAAQLAEMIEFFTNNPDPKYRASVKLGVTAKWYDKTEFHDSFKKAEVISPWFSGTTDYNRGQSWCDQNGVDYMPVVHPGFSWFNLKYPEPSSNPNRNPREGGKFLWDEVNDVIPVSVKSVYIAMYDEIDEGTAMFKLAENDDMIPREGYWLPLDEDGFVLPSDWYLRAASQATQVVRGYEDLEATLGIPPEGIMTIRITDEANDNNQGAMEFIFPDFPGESNIEISIDGGTSFPYSTPDNAETFSISGLSEGTYPVLVRHGAASPAVDMGDVVIGNVFEGLPDQASGPYPGDADTEVRVNATLGWTAGEQAVTHHIYFGTTPSPEFQTFQFTAAFNPGDLEPNTTYYWRIDEENGSGKVEGPLWSFTTGDIGGPSDIVVLDYCDEVAGWKSSNGLVLDSEEKMEGFASLSCEGSSTDKFKKTFDNPVNSLCDANSYFNLWIYVSDVSAFSGGGQIELSSAGKNDVDELNWSVGALNLTNGWNEVKLQIKNAGVMGSPDLSAINFFRFYQNVGSTSIITKIDYLHFSELAYTSAGPSLEYIEELPNFKMYPNPASSETTIQFSMEESADVAVRIFDMGGRELHQFIENEHWMPGDHTIRLPLNGFLKGAYLIHVKVDNKVMKELLVIE